MPFTRISPGLSQLSQNNYVLKKQLLEELAQRHGGLAPATLPNTPADPQDLPVCVVVSWSVARLMRSLSPGDRRAFQHKTSGSGEAEAISVLGKTSSNILTLTGVTWHETQTNNKIHTAQIHSYLPQSVLFEISECRQRADVAWALAEQMCQQRRQGHPQPPVQCKHLV